MNKNLLLGFPRSGSNWLRYIIEAVTNYQTGTRSQIKDLKQGNVKKVFNIFSKDREERIFARRDPFWLNVKEVPNKDYFTSPWFIHTHMHPYKQDDSENWKLLRSNSCLLIGVIRDPVECISRELFEDNEIQKFNEVSIIKDYFRILKLFEDYSGPKLILHYEDLINKNEIKNVLFKISNFVDVNHICKENFLKNIDTHISISKKIYEDAKSDGSNKFYYNKNKNISKINKNILKKYISDNKINTSLIKRYGF